MFCHTAWAVPSYISGPLAARTVGIKSTLGFNRPDGTPCRSKCPPPTHQSDAALGGVGDNIVVLVDVPRGSPGAVLGEGAEHLKVLEFRVLQPMLYRELQ